MIAAVQLGAGSDRPRPAMLPGLGILAVKIATFVRRLSLAGRSLLLLITDRKRATTVSERDVLRAELLDARQTLDARARSIAMTSHELRTPLNGILGMSDLLTRTKLSAEQASYVEAIETSAAALLTLVDNMLDAGKIAAGRWQPRPRPVIVEALIEEVVELLAPRAQAKGLELAAHVGQQVPEAVSVDPEQLARILMNLAGNALKFTDRGGVAIEVAVDQSLDGAVRLAISVRDSGIGIARADQVRIFGEYEQADAGPGARSPGTGLGLAISRAMAEAMSGSLTLDSAVGEGSTFCLRIEVPIVRPRTAIARLRQGKHILLISDRTVEPPLLMRRLFDLGVSVELARSIDAARDVLAAGRGIDAILFDQAGALDAAEFVVRAQPSPPIAVMVAPVDRHVIAPLRLRGIRAHLVKPIRTASLTKVLSALLDDAMLAEDVDDERAAGPRGKDKDVRILLADDNDINILLGRSTLESLGYPVEVARDGAAAVACVTAARAEGRRYDLILMDLHMPVLDGFAAIKSIRAAEPNAERTFIVALTADITDVSSARAIEAGADMTLTKPIDHGRLADLLASIRRLRGAPTEPTTPDRVMQEVSAPVRRDMS